MNQLDVQQCIIDKTITGVINYFQLFVLDNNKLRTIINGDGTNAIISNATLNINTWYLVTVTWDGTSLKYFINGKKSR